MTDTAEFPSGVLQVINHCLQIVRDCLIDKWNHRHHASFYPTPINVTSRPSFPSQEDVGKMPIINSICGNQVTANSKRKYCRSQHRVAKIINKLFETWSNNKHLFSNNEITRLNLHNHMYNTRWYIVGGNQGSRSSSSWQPQTWLAAARQFQLGGFGIRHGYVSKVLE